MRLYFKYMELHLKSALQYKVSFMLSLISQLFVFFTYYFVVLTLFSKFDNVTGFTLYEILLTFGIIQFGFAFNETFCRGIDHFDKLIKAGEFDRILTKPVNILLQVLCYEFDFTKIMRILQSIIVLIIAIINLDINWNILKVIAIILMLLSSVVIFFSIFLLASSYCFITIEGLEVRNIFTDGGKHMAQYPIGIFNKGFRFVFTFIIPYAVVNYYPLLYVIGKSNNYIYAFLPLFVFIFLFISLFTFKKMSSRYTSAGS